MFLEHNSNIVLEFLDNIMLCEHNVSDADFIFGREIIRDAVLDKRLTQRQVIDAIRTYDFRLVRAITAFEEALNILG